MANVLRIRVENSSDLLNTGAYGAGAIIRVQSSTTQTGTFANVTTAALVSGTASYTAYDASGTSTTWYRLRYESSNAATLSDWADPFEAVPATYASLEDAKQRLNIPSTDTTDDENLLQFCVNVTAFIENYTHRQFLPDAPDGTSTTYTFDGYDAVESGRCLLIPTGIRSISLLEVATTTGGTFQTMTSGDYFIRPTVQERDPGWPGTEVWITDIPTAGDPVPFFPPGFANVRITGTFGWAACPSEIEDVALTLVVSKWRSRSAAGGDTFQIGPDGERSFERLLSYEDKQTLRRYQMRPLVIV